MLSRNNCVDSTSRWKCETAFFWMDSSTLFMIHIPQSSTGLQLANDPENVLFRQTIQSCRDGTFGVAFYFIKSTLIGAENHHIHSLTRSPSNPFMHNNYMLDKKHNDRPNGNGKCFCKCSKCCQNKIR